ncbi:MAG: RNA-splicing ligase RtcB, partial [Xanthomarina sp.]
MKPYKIITGKDIKNLGFPAGAWYKEAIAYINKNELRANELDAYLKQFKLPPALPLFYNPVSYSKNIAAENSDEEDNLEKVFATMDVVMRTPTVVGGAVMP